MGTAAADFAKKARESDSPPHNTQGYFGGQSVKNGKGGNHIYSTKESKRLRQFRKLPQPSFCAKSCRSPVLAGPDTHKPFQQVSWLTHPQLSANVFSETSNDRFSPHAGTSALTVAVPLGSCTRFPILFQGPTGPEALKPLFTFRFILPQPIGNVNKQPSRKTGLLRKNAVFMLSAPPTASEEAGTGPGPPRRGRPCCPYPPLAG